MVFPDYFGVIPYVGIGSKSQWAIPNKVLGFFSEATWFEKCLSLNTRIPFTTAKILTP